MIYEQHFSIVIGVVPCDPPQSPLGEPRAARNEKVSRSHHSRTRPVAATSQPGVLPCLRLTALLFWLGLCFLIILLC